MSANLPLAGFRILSAEQYGAGPYGTMFLAQLGAEVIKIEQPGVGDTARAVGPHFLREGESLYFQSFNLNKRSITLDLNSDEGKDVLRTLVQSAHGVVNNLRGDLPEKIGLTYDALKAVNPAIVCAHLSAYGRDNERARWPGYDYLMQAEAGFMTLTGDPGTIPTRFGLSMVDFMTGTMMSIGLLAALVDAQRSGVGRDVDVDLLSAAIHQTSYPALWYMNEGDVTERTPRSAHPSVTPSQVFRTADGWVFVMAQLPKFWTVLTERIGCPEIAQDPRFMQPLDRLANREALTEILDAVFSEQMTAYWIELLAGHMPVAPVLTLDQALDNPYLRTTGMVASVDHPDRPDMQILANPIRLSGQRLPNRAAPLLGADTDAVLAHAGIWRGAYRGIEVEEGGLTVGKLSGIRVVDLSQFLPGPMLSVMMADQGAEVIKVEPKAGDPARAQAPFVAGQSVWFRNLNRGKRSVVLDLKSDAGREALWALIDEADVFVEGFRPGVIRRLGFGYEAVSARNPRIVYCSISAFGQSGALSHHPAHDMAVQAMAGFLSVNDGPDGMPVVPGVPSADMAAGLTALSAVLMGLIGRERTGRGDYVDIAMFDAMLPWCAHTAGNAISGGEPPRSATQRSLGGAAFYNVYETADGRHIVLGGRELKFVHNLLEALGRPDLIPLGEAEPGEGQARLLAFLRETFRSRTREDWIGWFADKDVAFSPVLDFREAFTAPHLLERGLVIETDGAHQIAPSIRFAEEPAWRPVPAPELGDG